MRCRFTGTAKSASAGYLLWQLLGACGGGVDSWETEGIVFAEEAIGEALRETTKNEKGILDGIEKRFLQLQGVLLNGDRILKIGGSPRYDMCGTDFGWGRSGKFEAIHIDRSGHVFLSESEGGVEISLSMGNVKMDVFAAIFEQGLTDATKKYHLSKL